MSAATQYPHLTLDAGGTVRIGGTRYKVLHLVGEHYHYGWSAEELMRQHPDLKPGEVYAALAYFYDHHDAMVKALQALPDREAALPKPSLLSRQELLRRRKGRGL